MCPFLSDFLQNSFKQMFLFKETNLDNYRRLNNVLYCRNWQFFLESDHVVICWFTIYSKKIIDFSIKKEGIWFFYKKIHNLLIFSSVLIKDYRGSIILGAITKSENNGELKTFSLQTMPKFLTKLRWIIPFACDIFAPYEE